ncbi:MAG: hypothetical protein A2Y71_05385 [Bacteroidetes bacterium RBG_13_42_15]|nr:MAG: hypothetical protein A2Y71_05385 [Bacteroidetes bacterium RBG_13_42_15]
MNNQDKTKDELIKELQKLQHEYDLLKTSYEKDITERKPAEMELPEPGIHDKELMDLSRDVVFSLTSQGLFGSMNQAFEKITGWQVQEWIGKPFTDLLHPEDIPLAAERFSNLLKGHTAQAIELRIRKKSGDYGWTEVLASPLVKKGMITGLLGIGRDITERKQLEEETNLRNEELTALNDIMTAISSSLDLRRILDQSLDKVLELAGLECGSMYLLDQHVGEIVLVTYRGVSKEFADTVRTFKLGESLVGLAAQSGQPVVANDVTQDSRVTTALVSEEKILSFAAIPMISMDKVQGVMNLASHQYHAFNSKKIKLYCAIGNQVGMAIQNAWLYEVTKQELTERKLAEEALQESEDRYRDLVENSQDLICIHDLEGRIISANPWSAKVLGYEMDTILQMNIRDFLVPEVRRGVEVYLARIRKNGTAKGLLQVQTAAGEHRIWEYNNSLRTEGVDVPVVRGIAHDITERKRAEEKVLLANERLQYLLSSTSAVVYSAKASGDFGTTFISSNVVQIVGYDQEDFIRDSGLWYDHVHPEDQVIVSDEITRLFEKGLHAYEYRFKCKDGRNIWVRDEMKLIRDHNKNPLEIIGFWTDITERKKKELENQVIHEIAQGINTTSNLDELLKLIHHSLGKVVYAENFFVVLHDQKTGLFNFPYFIDKYDQIPLSASLRRSCTAYVFRTAKPLLISQEIFNNLKEQNEIELVGTPSPSWIGIPLITPAGIIGVLVLQHYEEENVYSEDDVKFLLSIGSQIAVAIQRKQAEEALVIANDRLAHDLESMTRLHILGTLLVREDGMHAALQEMLDVAIAIANADMGNIQLLDRQSGSLKIRVHRGFEQPFLDFWDSVLEGQGTCGTALEMGERVIVEDVSQSPIFAGSPALDAQLAAGVRAVQSTPLIGRSGNMIGMCSTHFRTPHRPDEQTLHLLDLHARQVSDIIERVEAEETLRLEKENFRNSLDDSPLGVRIATKEGKTIYANKTLLDLYGYDSLGELQQTPLKDRYTSESYAQAQERKRQRERGDLSDTDYEISIVRKDGEVRHLQVFRKEVLWDGVRQFQLICNDITERKRIEKMLQKSESKYRNLIEQAPDIIFVVDAEGDLLNVNKTGQKMLGYSEDELCKMKTVDTYMTDEMTVGHHRLKEFRAMRAGEAMQFERLMRRKDGSSFPVEINVAALADGNAHAIIRDITERKQVEEELRKSKKLLEDLHKHLDEIRENERAVISREIHDQIGQSLTALKLDLNWMTRHFKNASPEATVKLQGMIELISKTIKDVQRISSDLRPGILDDLGLAAAVEWYCDEFEKRTGIRCSLKLDDSTFDDSQKSLVFFRVLQEALTNVIRHANASSVTIKLHQSKQRITMTIHDNGIGIPEEKIESYKSLGLISIRERVRQFDGKFVVSAKEGNGTKLTVFIPK